MSISPIIDQITEARDKLRCALEREQRAYDALTEDLQMSPIGDALETKMERLMDGIAEMDETLRTLRKARPHPTPLS